MKINKKRSCFLLAAVSSILLLSGCQMKELYENIRTEISQEGAAVDELFRGGDNADTEKTGYASDVKLSETESIDTASQETSDSKTKDTEVSDTASGIEGSDPYAKNYAYLALDGQTKQVYDEVLTAILLQKEKVEVATSDIQVLEQAYKAVCADYGGLFWISGYAYTQYTRGGKLISMDFSPKYTMDYDKRMELQAQIDASTEELLDGISVTDSDYDKAKYVFEILVQNVDYDSSVDNNQNIISAFLNRATVCQGYACATQYLLKMLGMESVIVTGTANGESHAWNLVKLDGNYYYMDTTWGNSRYLNDASQTAKYVNYNYLAVTSEEISRTHTADASFPLPECSSMEDNYFVREQSYFADWQPEAVGAILKEAWDAQKDAVAVKFSAAELYEQALDYFITKEHIADYCENISSVYYLEDTELHVLTFHFS